MNDVVLSRLSDSAPRPEASLWKFKTAAEAAPLGASKLAVQVVLRIKNRFCGGSEVLCGEVVDNSLA